MRRDLQLLLLFVTAGVRDLTMQLKCFSPGGPYGTRLGPFYPWRTLTTYLCKYPPATRLNGCTESKMVLDLSGELKYDDSKIPDQVQTRITGSLSCVRSLFTLHQSISQLH